MIAYIKGTVVERLEDSILLDHHGLAYEIFMSNPSALKLNSESQVFTYQHVREDALLLFGFPNQHEKNVFMEIINVKGIGPKTAMNILSKTSGQRFVEAIEKEDLSFLKTLPGIGPKTASQILLDLKGKFVSTGFSSLSSLTSPVIDEALSALKELGFKNTELKRIEKIMGKSKEDNLDALVKLGLQNLARKGGR